MTIPPPSVPGVARPVDVDLGELRRAIHDEYAAVATTPERGFHFNTGRAHALNLGYHPGWLDGIPSSVVDSFAGMGNPFAIAPVRPGDQVVDVGCGAGIDSLIAAGMTSPGGRVIGVDLTPEMVTKATRCASDAGVRNAEFREGLGESLPVPDAWADVVISNGVLNLMPDKSAGLREMARVLKPGGRLQIADISVQKAIPEKAKLDIDLWKG